ncbi:MAG: hypothetical protein A2340_05285 [Lentisphaerae bacterium RIFOXYB12_FULL_60_10]|nr:MAG: hypothetical protein A2340_05285 [Lentisphaerae bacterium RIFOXYB12_FULL_60_10]
MINELYDLWNACEKCRIDLPERVPGFDEGQNADGMRVYIGADGSLSRLEIIPADQMKRIRKWKRGEGITLPVFNFEPLHEVSGEDFKQLSKWQNAKVATERLPTLLDAASGSQLLIRWDEGPQSRRQKLESAFTNVSEDIEKRIKEDQSGEGDAWRALLKTLRKIEIPRFLDDLSARLRQTIRDGCRDGVALQLLFHNKQKKKPSTVPVQFEPTGSFLHPVYSPTAQAWLKATLSRSIHATTGKKSKAVWGDGGGSDSKYGEITLPIGKVSLFNKDGDAKPTSARYGSGGPLSFPVGNDVRVKLMAASEWLFDPTRRNRTWTLRALASGKKKRNFLLAAYADRLTQTAPALVTLFCGTSSEKQASTEVRFEVVAQGVVSSLDGMVKEDVQAKVRVFALYKPDGFRTEVFLSEVFHAVVLRRLAGTWREDMRQYPVGILIRQFDSAMKQTDGSAKPRGDSRKVQVVYREPEIPFPYQVVECLNTIWYRGGNEATEAADVGVQDAFQLLLVTRGEQADYLLRLLNLALRRSVPLMLAVGQAGNCGRIFHPEKASGLGAFQSLRWPCILGFFLSRLGFKKEVYVNEPAFLIGRMLSLTDSLHSYYAKNVSKKTEMPQLLGNSLMSVAMERPQDAFVLLGQRILPYQAWAYSYSRGKAEDAETVGKILGAMSKVASKLAEMQVPEEIGQSCATREGSEGRKPAKDVLDASPHVPQMTTQAAKAQMLLGYLARGGSAKSKDCRAAAGEGDAFGFDNEQGGQL